MFTTQQKQKVVWHYCKEKPVKKVYLFGSYTRGEAEENNDVDLLVDLENGKAKGWQFFVWFYELEKTFSKKRCCFKRFQTKAHEQLEAN